MATVDVGWLGQTVTLTLPDQPTLPVSFPQGKTTYPVVALAAGQSISAAVLALKAPSYIRLPAGTLETSDFAMAATNAMLWMPNLRGFIGAGRDPYGNHRTKIQMKANTSTRGAYANGLVKGQVNLLWLIRLDGDDCLLQDLAVIGTDQGHLYNGVRFYSGNNGLMLNVDLIDVRGSGGEPPTETFYTDARIGGGTRWSYVRAINTQPLSGSGFASNSGAHDLSWDNCVGIGFGPGAAWALSIGYNFTFTNCSGMANKKRDLNFENLTGFINVGGFTFSAAAEIQAAITNATGTATLTFKSGTKTPTGKLTVRAFPKGVGGVGTSQQVRSAITADIPLTVTD
jgi:hypothetical protein